MEEERTTDDPCASSQEQAHDGRNDPHLGELPVDRFPFVRSIVIGYGDSSNTIETVSITGEETVDGT